MDKEVVHLDPTFPVFFVCVFCFVLFCFGMFVCLFVFSVKTHKDTSPSLLLPKYQLRAWNYASFGENKMVSVAPLSD